MHLPYIIFYDIGVLDKKIFLRKNSMQKKNQNKKPNKKTELSFPNDYSLYIPMDLYNFDTPNPWLPNPYCGEHDLKKKILNLPYLRILSRTNSILLGPENMHTFRIISTWKKVCSFILTHWIFFFHQTMFCAKFDWN